MLHEGIINHQIWQLSPWYNQDSQYFTGDSTIIRNYGYVRRITLWISLHYMNRNVGLRTFGYMRPTKTQIGLRIRTVWLELLLSAWRHVASLAIQNAPSEDSDQPAQVRRLIWISTGGTCPKIRFLPFRLICKLWKQSNCSKNERKHKSVLTLICYGSLKTCKSYSSRKIHIIFSGIKGLFLLAQTYQFTTSYIPFYQCCQNSDSRAEERWRHAWVLKTSFGFIKWKGAFEYVPNS